MSSPIAIPRATKTISVRRYSDDAHHESTVTRSLPTNTSGVYVPVHRRGASASSLPETRKLSAGRSNERNASPRTRSVSPMSTNRYNLLASATIPLTTSMIPQTHTSLTYSLTDLLALSSSSAVGLSPLQRSIVDAHIPLMMSRVSSPRTKKPAQSTTVATSPDAQPQKKSESSPRRRRTGRKPSGAKARVPSAVVGADVRRRAAYGAGWGWTASDRVAGQRAEFGRVPRQVETWRAAESLVVAATA